MPSLADSSRSPNDTAMQETPMRKILDTMAAAVVVVALAGTASAQSLTKITIATGVDPAFSQFYVAKEGGLFEKNGLDVTINTGPSGSAMVPFLINNQVQAAYGSDLSGVINHQIDNNVVDLMVDDAGQVRSVGSLHLVIDEEWNHRRARRTGVDRHIEAVLLEQTALLGHIELREGWIDAGRNGDLRERLRRNCTGKRYNHNRGGHRVEYFSHRRLLHRSVLR